MKRALFVLLILISITGFSISQQPKPTHRNAKFQHQRVEEKRNYIDVTMGIGIDNNQDFMVSVGLSYKHKYKFIGLGGNLDLYIMKNSFEKDDVSDIEIPHNDYHISNYENSAGFDFDMFGVLNYGGVFLNLGYTVFLIRQTSYNISNVTGWKWKGGSNGVSYTGFLAQLQFYIPMASPASKMGFTLLGEARILNKTNNMYSMKFGMYF